MIAVYILIAIAALMFMIVVHELGHYSAGRALKFKINEFAVGIGPAIFKRKSKKTGITYSLRCIPLGGFCAFEGEDNESDSPASFEKQKPWKRIIVLAAGAMFNFIAALLLITIFFTAYGNCFPNIGVRQFADGAEQVLQDGDVVLEVNGERLWYMIEPDGIIKKLSGEAEEARLLVLRDGKELTLNLKKGIYTADDGQNYKGYGLYIRGMTPIKLNFFAALGDSFIFIFKAVGQLFATLGGLFTGALGLKGTIGGPIMAVSSLVTVTQASWFFLIYAVCVLSSNLAVLNLMPIPGLDGSKIVFTVIEWIRGKPLNRKFENWFHLIGMVLMFGLTIIMDIVNLF